MAELDKKRILVFASGSSTGGGSGFENLVKASLNGTLDAKIVGVVSNHASGGVFKKAMDLAIPFRHFPDSWEAEGYRKIVADLEPDLVALSGWLKLVKGLDPKRTINIHPGRLPETAKLYGHLVHERSLELYREGKIKETAVTMQFVTDVYDAGPIFFVHKVKIKPNDTPETLAARVNMAEHAYQHLVTNAVVTGLIYWDGVNPKSLVISLPWCKPD